MPEHRRLDPARLVVFNGTNVSDRADRTSFWVAPGEHTMVIAAAKRQGIDKPRYFKPRGGAGLAFD